MLTLIPMCCVTSINMAESYNYAVKFILFCTYIKNQGNSFIVMNTLCNMVRQFCV